MAWTYEIITRLGLSDSVGIPTMSAEYLFGRLIGGSYKGNRLTREIVNMICRAGRFWEALGTYCVFKAWLKIGADASCFYLAQSTLLYTNTALLKVGKTQFHIIV